MRGVELCGLTFEDLQLHVAMDKNMYTIKVHRKKQKGPKIQSSFMVTSPTLVQAIDDYIQLFEQTQRAGRFWRKQMASGKPSKQPIGIHTLATFPKEIASFLGLVNPEKYTGHCWRRTGGTILADQGASVLDLQRAGGWGSSVVAETYVAESSVQKEKVASIFDFDKKGLSTTSLPLMQSTQSSLQMSKTQGALFANCSIVFNNCNMNFGTEGDKK